MDKNLLLFRITLKLLMTYLESIRSVLNKFGNSFKIRGGRPSRNSMRLIVIQKINRCSIYILIKQEINI